MSGTSDGDLLVTTREQWHRLSPGTILTFGRLPSCTVCLDPIDKAISRIAGAIFHEHGAWWVANRSETRALHVVDPVGLSVPLPVARSGWPTSRRSIDGAGLRVLVTGGIRTHELRCELAGPQAQDTTVVRPTDTESTIRFASLLTERRRVVLVAMVSGYLKPFPRYDPHPLTYAEIATMTGLPKPTVIKRIESVRVKLRDAGVPGLDAVDARQPLAEWLLATRLITADDLTWLDGQLAGGRIT